MSLPSNAGKLLSFIVTCVAHQKLSGEGGKVQPLQSDCHWGVGGVLGPDVLLVSCVTLGELFNLSVPLVPRL